MEYSLTSIAVLHLDAGNDRNGNPRRGFALIHATTGSLVAYADEGYKGELACLLEALNGLRTAENLPGREVIAKVLLERRTERIRVAPSYRTHLQRRTADREPFGLPLLTP